LHLADSVESVVYKTQEKAAETKDGNAVPKALAYKDGVTYKQCRPVSAGSNNPMSRVIKSSKGPRIEQAFFYTGPNKSDVGTFVQFISPVTAPSIMQFVV